MSLKNIIKNIATWQAFTVRGFIILLLSLLALFVYAIPENDFAAYVLGGSALGLILLNLILITALRVSLPRKIDAKLKFDTVNLFSNQDVPSGIILKNSNMIPFFHLKVKRVFENPGVSDITHIAKGRTGKEGKRQLLDLLKFPHRGVWQTKGLKLSICDSLGFLELSWFYPRRQEVEISAKNVPIKELPIIVSSASSGDQVSFDTVRNGDLYDIKSYDPSDGLKKVLWKVYAKTGELVVRRAEPAVIPEGEIAMYLVASKEEDYIAGVAQHYIQELEKRNIEALFGTDGISNFQTDKNKIRKSINSSVWKKSAGTAANIGEYLDSLLREKHLTRQIIVFCNEDLKLQEVIRKSTAQRNIKVSIAIVPDELRELSFRNSFQKKRKKRGTMYSLNEDLIYCEAI